jgi:hypothetical protein
MMALGKHEKNELVFDRSGTLFVPGPTRLFSGYPQTPFHRRDAEGAENFLIKNNQITLRTLRLCGEFICLRMNINQVPFGSSSSRDK